MTQLFNGVKFVYRSVEESETSSMAACINYTGDFSCFVLDRLFDNLTDKSYLNVDDRSNVDVLGIITRETKSKFQPTIGVCLGLRNLQNS